MAAHLRQAAKLLGKDPDEFVRAHLAARSPAGEYVALECPDAMFRAWDVFLELSASRGPDAAPITHQEIGWWQTNLDVKLSPLEVMGIRRLDVLWMEVVRDGSRAPRTADQ